jgi:site-specific DNA-methyltransferase (adenine-specific)
MPKLEITNEDNMDLMARYPDKHFDLAIVDPPYGDLCNLHEGHESQKNGWGRWNEEKQSKWNKAPNKKYFKELFRVSKNQIVWGGNYFIESLKNTRCLVIWDKGQREFSLADAEIAWTSFEKPVRIFNYSRARATMSKSNSFHPTEKPIALYQWLLKNYAKEGDKILDTHLGSMSIAIAIHQMNTEQNMNLTLTGCELDEEYYKAGLERVNNAIKQKSLFDENSHPVKEIQPQYGKDDIKIADCTNHSLF